jgi:hypothetical protein
MAGFTLENLALRIDTLFGIPLDDLQSGTRKSPVVESRSVFCFWAVRHASFASVRVGAFLHMTPPAVGYAVGRGKAIAHKKGYSF